MQGKEVMRVRLDQTGEVIEVDDDDLERVCPKLIITRACPYVPKYVSVLNYLARVCPELHVCPVNHN